MQCPPVQTILMLVRLHVPALPAILLHTWPCRGAIHYAVSPVTIT